MVHVLPILALLLVPPLPNAPLGAVDPVPVSQCGARDFDFEFGEWSVTLRRLAEPLTGADEWIEYSGTSVVRPVWGGRANLGELDVSGDSGRILGMSLRLHSPESCEWLIHWANSRNGLIGPATIGGFRNGTGEFYSQELFNGRAVFVRFIFSEITETTFRFEQSFSDDGGRTWEPNWVAEFVRGMGS